MTTTPSIRDALGPSRAKQRCACGHLGLAHLDCYRECLFKACACVRFSWVPPTPADLAEQAREIMRTLRGLLRSVVLGRTQTIGPRTASRLLELKLIRDSDGGLTELGQTIRDGWTCELCHTWHPAGEEHFSREDCNETGRGVQLCEECSDG